MPSHQRTAALETSLNTILVLGDGPCAAGIAEALVQWGKTVTVAASCRADEWATQSDAEKGPAVLCNTRVAACHGQMGSFHITLVTGDHQLRQCFDGIIIAPETIRRPNYGLYGLMPSESVLCLSQLGPTSKADPSARGKMPDGIPESAQVLFLTGLVHDSNPVIMKEVMQAALDLQDRSNARCFVLTNNVKVAESGLEALYHRSRSAGVAYFKPAEGVPAFSVASGRVESVSFFDDMIRKRFLIKPDLVVVDETILPSPELADLSRIFGLETSSSGFAQSGNIHRLAVATNRPGIFVAGPGRQIQSWSDQMIDGQAAVLAVIGSGTGATPEPVASPLQIDTDRCVRCLTCLRLCPYGAIDLTDDTPVITGVCQFCYLCSVECPRQAISADETVEVKVTGTDKAQEEVPESGAFDPRLTVFVCRRSALPAAKMAMGMGASIPSRLTLIPVPCAGGIGLQHILTAFRSGTDGVLLLTCHEGNCHSETGNHHARERAKHLSSMLPQLGLAPQRLETRSLAANMGAGFARSVAEFENSIRRLGPLEQTP